MTYFYNKIGFFFSLVVFFFFSIYGDPLLAGEIKARNEPTQKLHCLLYGNCQIGFVHRYLKHNYPNDYEFKYVCNWQIINENETFPFEEAKNADLFIYQPLVGHGNLDTDLVKSYLKQTCICVSCPYIYFLGYFPDHTSDHPRNKKTLSDQAPYGYFPCRQTKVEEWVEKGCYSPDEIVEISRRDDFLSADYIWKKLKYGLNVLREKESSTDVKLADFIEANYAQEKLFHSHNHPTNRLLKEFIKQILILIYTNSEGVETNAIFDIESESLNSNPVIYPCVAKTLHLQFETDETVCLSKKHVSYEDYIKEYIRWLFPEYN